MSIDNDNSDYEAKRAEQRRILEKQNAKAAQEKDPMRSFEAKLSKESVREEATRDSLRKSQQELKKTVEENAAVLKKILGDKTGDSAADLATKAKHHEQAFLQQKGLKGKVLEEKIEEKSDEQDDEDNKLETTNKQNEAKDVEHTDQKVLGIIDEESGSEGQSFGGSGGGASAGDSNESGSGADDAELQALFGGSLVPGQLATGASGADLSQGFGSSGSNFLSPEDLDQIVASVQHQINQNGHEVFTVKLNNDFFEGLQIETRRTPQGIVLTLICPNVLVRTEMLRHKKDILKRFAEKQIQVQEVELR